jgi:uncharacterized protein
VEDVGEGRALLFASAIELAGRFGDPQGLLSPANRIQKPAPKVGRNDRCPCGSGRKYKQCCLGKG